MTEALQKAEQENERLREIVYDMASALLEISEAFADEGGEEDMDATEEPWAYHVAKDMVFHIDTKYGLQHLSDATQKALTDNKRGISILDRLRVSPEDKGMIVEHFLS
jgi:hypothetical protein